MEAIGITFQYNHLGPLLPGAGGNNLKDRSAGLVVRYNWIEHSNRQLDLVHAEDSSLVRADPRYRATHVYGNVIIEHPNSGNNDICFYGGDGGSAQKFRKGTLYFYNNTVVSDRTDNTRLFRMATNDESIDARNNIAYVTAAGGNLQVLDNFGRLTLTQNWFKTGWTPFVGEPSQGHDHEQRHRHRHVARLRERGRPGLPPHRRASQAIDAGTALNPAGAAHPRRRPRVREAPRQRAARACTTRSTSAPTSSDDSRAGRKARSGRRLVHPDHPRSPWRPRSPR